MISIIWLRWVDYKKASYASAAFRRGVARRTQTVDL